MPFKAGQSYKMTGQMLASTFTLNFPDTEYSSVSEDLSWTRRRKGALAFVLGVAVGNLSLAEARAAARR